MVCEDADVTISFMGPDNDPSNPFLEVRPMTMDFQRNLGEFDFARCKFSEEVAEFLKPYLDSDDGILNQTLSAVVNIDGEPVHRLLYLPDGVTFGVHNVTMELHDVRKYLQRGVVDYQRESVTLREAFMTIFKRREVSGPTMFKGVKFTVPEESYNELISRDTSDGVIDDLTSQNTSDTVIKAVEEENIVNIIDGHYAVNYEQVSPWKAMKDLCDKFGVRTWVAPDGYLYIGSRNATGVTHVAAPDDSRVWKIIPEGYNVTAPRDPVIKCVVRGKFVSDPSESWSQQASEVLNLDRNTSDYRAEGVAVREDADYGQEIVEDVDAAKDSLEGLALRKLIAAQREQWAGDLEILPSLSGSEWTELRYVQVGDRIVTIPSDDTDGRDCASNIGLEKFEITGVQHRVTGEGSWKTRLSVVPIADGPLNPKNNQVYMRYFDPYKEEYISEDTFTKSKSERGPFWTKVQEDGEYYDYLES